MRLGLFSDSLRHLDFEAMIDWLAAEGLEAVEIGTGNFSAAPHCDLERLLAEPAAQGRFLDAIAGRGLALSALNCSGNLLDPHPGRRERAQRTLERTLQAAELLGVATVVTMSGCPGDLAGGPYPNWVTCSWQAEYPELLERQWQEAIIPFWQATGRAAAERGRRIAIEMHPGQAVYNSRTLQRLRQAAGPAVGANLDPSHLFYQGMDPLVVVGHLGPDFIYHVHAKDTAFNPQEMALNGGLDARPMGRPGSRAWEYRTVGFGHDALWWRRFVSALRQVGYDGVLSIEHEDALMGAEEGIRKSVEFLGPILLRTPA
ncbi:MAG: sugar phosphate isomerase/epimerase family protein [Candidatus Promineifilaceae bacterium]